MYVVPPGYKGLLTAEVTGTYEGGKRTEKQRQRPHEAPG
jgi:hypothetical protein